MPVASRLAPSARSSASIAAAGSPRARRITAVAAAASGLAASQRPSNDSARASRHRRGARARARGSRAVAPRDRRGVRRRARGVAAEVVAEARALPPSGRDVVAVSFAAEPTTLRACSSAVLATRSHRRTDSRSAARHHRHRRRHPRGGSPRSGRTSRSGRPSAATPLAGDLLRRDHDEPRRRSTRTATWVGRDVRRRSAACAEVAAGQRAGHRAGHRGRRDPLARLAGKIEAEGQLGREPMRRVGAAWAMTSSICTMSSSSSWRTIRSAALATSASEPICFASATAERCWIALGSENRAARVRRAPRAGRARTP